MDLPQPKFTRKPLYQQVEEALRREIVSQRKPGDRLGTEPELARHYSVSLVTVRKALSRLAQKGLVEPRHGSGTYVTQPPAERHVAIWVEGDISLLSPFYLHALQAIRKTLNAAGQENRTFLGFARPTQIQEKVTCPDFLSDLRLGRLKAIFPLIGGPYASWVPEAEARGVPVIGWGASYARCLTWDCERSLNLTLERLQKQGRRRLAIIGWDNWHSNRRPFQELLEKVAPRWGFQLEPAFLQLRAHGSKDGMGWQSLREIWTSCRTKPDCFLIADETLFQSCVQAIHELKIDVPRDLDVALLTADYFKEKVDFPIIKAGFRIEEMAEAVSAAVSLIDRGEELPETMLIPSSFLPLNLPEWIEAPPSQASPREDLRPTRSDP